MACRIDLNGGNVVERREEMLGDEEADVGCEAGAIAQRGGCRKVKFYVDTRAPLSLPKNRSHDPSLIDAFQRFLQEYP